MSTLDLNAVCQKHAITYRSEFIPLVIDGKRPSKDTRKRLRTGKGGAALVAVLRELSAPYAGLFPPEDHAGQWEAVRRYVARRVSNANAVDDITQVVFERATRYTLSTLEYPGLPLLRTMAKRAISDWIRHSRARKRDERMTRRLGETIDPASDPATDAERREGNARIRRGLAGLSAEEQEAINLTLDGYSRRQAAEVLGLAPGVYQGRLRRALEELRRSL